MIRIAHVYGRGPTVRALFVHVIRFGVFDLRYVAGSLGEQHLAPVVKRDGLDAAAQLVERAALNERWLRGLSIDETVQRVERWRASTAKAGFTFFGTVSLTHLTLDRGEQK